MSPTAVALHVLSLCVCTVRDRKGIFYRSRTGSLCLLRLCVNAWRPPYRQCSLYPPFINYSPYPNASIEWPISLSFL